jgi:hypothetical protein
MSVNKKVVFLRSLGCIFITAGVLCVYAMGGQMQKSEDFYLHLIYTLCLWWVQIYGFFTFFRVK